MLNSIRINHARIKVRDNAATVMYERVNIAVVGRECIVLLKDVCKNKLISAFSFSRGIRIRGRLGLIVFLFSRVFVQLCIMCILPILINRVRVEAFHGKCDTLERDIFIGGLFSFSPVVIFVI